MIDNKIQINNLDILVIKGKDAEVFLQGQITNDIKITTVEHADEVLKIALTKELKRVEWVEVESISKPNDKSQASIQ